MTHATKVSRLGEKIIETSTKMMAPMPGATSRCSLAARNVLTRCSNHNQHVAASLPSARHFTTGSRLKDTSSSFPAVRQNSAVGSTTTSVPPTSRASRSPSSSDSMTSLLEETLRLKPLGQNNTPKRNPAGSSTPYSYSSGVSGNSANDVLRSFDDSPLFSQLPSLNRYPLPPSITMERTPIKVGPTTGRTVEVKDAADLVRSFRNLDILVARNRIRADFNKQRFHERPGLKRKRLKSERWRRNFKAQFVATIALAQKMKRQGW